MTIPPLVASSMCGAPSRWRDRDLGAGQLGWHRVVVAAEGDQRLRAGGPRHGQDGRERRRHRRQRLGRGDGGHGGLAVGGRAHAGVAAQQTPPVQRGLGLLGRDVVGQGAPPALRGGVVGLLHHALAVAAPGRADRHRHPVVLGDRGEGGGDPAGARVADGGHPVEPPGAGQPAQRDADPVQARRSGAAGR